MLLFFLSFNLLSAAENKNIVEETILLNILLKKELLLLDSIKNEGTESYKIEIDEKRKALSFLQNTLKRKFGLIQNKEGSKIYNPFPSKFDQAWFSIIEDLKKLDKSKCDSNNKLICNLLSDTSLDGYKTYFMTKTSHNKIDILNQHVINNHWTEALRLAHSLATDKKKHRLTYEIIQRIYSFKHQGSGKVGIKGI